MSKKIILILYMEKNYKMILSIIWGLGLASIFRKICDKNSCVVIKAPLDMSSYYQKNNEKCYSFSKTEC
tara:strand:+ start:2335 stop:2541 length:207 start_codon:yes stop_codon:yes gene_type:complete